MSKRTILVPGGRDRGHRAFGGGLDMKGEDCESGS